MKIAYGIISKVQYLESLQTMKPFRVPFIIMSFIILSLIFLPNRSAVKAKDMQISDPFSCENVSDVPQSECDSLVALFDQTDGNNWYNNTNWLLTNTVGDWYGITVEEGHITRIILLSNGLLGSIPTEIGGLSHLERLELSGNSLGGNIPSSIVNLTNLIVLALNNNDLQGPIPEAIGNLSKLQFLDLSSNLLSGGLENSLSALLDLEGLNLEENNLSGSIALNWENLQNLETLSLAFNQFSGEIPVNLSTMEQLWLLNLSNNNLEGFIPISMGNFRNLLDQPMGIRLNSNQLTGPIPSELGNLDLYLLDLQNNQLSGFVPASFGHFPRMEYLYLANNNFYGSIPESFLSLNMLNTFTFNSTFLCESDSSPFIAWKESIQTWNGTNTICGEAVANFSGLPVFGSSPLNVRFSNESLGDLSHCLWTFGDGNTSLICENPQHEYLIPGDYSVSLSIVGTENSDYFEIVDYISVGEEIDADFSAAPLTGVAPLTVNFANNSSGEYTNCSWDFGDATTSSECNDPVHEYVIPGLYSVSLTVGDSVNSDAVQKLDYIEVGQQIVADFTASPLSGSLPLTVRFENNSSGDITFCHWDFGDGTSSEICENPIHVYQNVGTFDVTLTVNGGFGSDSKTESALINIDIARNYLPLISK